MLNLSLRFIDNRFCSYEYTATVVSKSLMSERRLQRCSFRGALGAHEYALRAPAADLDFMIEMAMRKYSSEHYAAIDGHLDDIEIHCLIDTSEDDSQENVSLSALLAWLNHYSLDDDSFRESVVDLRLVEQRWLLTCLEHGLLTAEAFAEVVYGLLHNPDETMVQLGVNLL